MVWLSIVPVMVSIMVSAGNTGRRSPRCTILSMTPCACAIMPCEVSATHCRIVSVPA